MAVRGYSAAGSRLFVDPDFPVSAQSLTKDARSQRVVWLRPHEIVRNPVFVHDSFSRFDLDQGHIGDCWFVTGVTSLVVSGQKQLMERCIPPDQSFTYGYTGMFKFNFWQFGKWREVVVDDRLPTVDGQLIYARNRSQPSEFWVPLLEKAYAKLHGSYENLECGFSQDACVDMSGGISERIELKAFKGVDQGCLTGLYADLKAMMAKCSMLSCSIYETSTNRCLLQRTGLARGHSYTVRKLVDEQRSFAPCLQPQRAASPDSMSLITGHAYSIIKMEVVIAGNHRQHKLVCLRNPWGRGEWTGDWSDSSSMWRNVSLSEKRRIGFEQGDDGDFWMSFEEFVQYFDCVYICHLSPDALSRRIASKENWNPWRSCERSGKFSEDKSLVIRAGQTRCDNCCMVVSLMQKTGADRNIIDISFKVSVYDERAQTWKLRYQPEFANSREVTLRFNVPPGMYCITPQARRRSSTEYLLRVFAEHLAS